MKVTDLPFTTFYALSIFFIILGVSIFSFVATMIGLSLNMTVLFVIICLVISAMTVDFLMSFIDV